MLERNASEPVLVYMMDNLSKSGNVRKLAESYIFGWSF